MSSAAAPGPRDNERRWFSAAVAFIVAVCAAVMVFGCSPRIVEKVIVQRDTTRIVQRDSVRFYDRDSIFVRVAGDTVYKYVEKWRLTVTLPPPGLRLPRRVAGLCPGCRENQARLCAGGRAAGGGGDGPTPVAGVHPEVSRAGWRRTQRRPRGGRGWDTQRTRGSVLWGPGPRLDPDARGWGGGRRRAASPRSIPRLWFLGSPWHSLAAGDSASPLNAPSLEVQPNYRLSVRPQ